MKNKLVLLLLPLIAIISLTFATPALATGSVFNASNVNYNGTSHVLSACVSSIDPLFTGHFSGWGISDQGFTEALNGSNGRFADAFSQSITDPATISQTLTSGTFDPVAGNVYLYLNSDGGDGMSVALTYPDDFSGSGSCSSPTATPTPSSSSGAFNFVLNPTDKAKINGAVSSIPNTAKAEIFAIFPVVMPYILIVVSIGIAFALLSFFMSKAKHNH